MTFDNLPQIGNVSLEDTPTASLPQKPVDMLYSPKSLLLPGSPNSLNRLMCSRPAVKGGARSMFMRDCEQKKKKCVSFTCSDIDYGYEYAEPAIRPTKRRKYERRNSKTPQMLLAMSAANINLDFLEEKDNEDKDNNNRLPLVMDDDDDDDNWDGGLEIAEELVKQLQQRRRGNVC